MNISFSYSQAIENLIIYSAFFFFFIFLIYVLIAKTSSGKESYAKVNRLHIKFFFLYFLSAIGLMLYSKDFTYHSLLGLLTGSFIYLGLHYVYLFPIIGLTKKSISINILASIKELELQNVKVYQEILAVQMNINNLGIGHIRENRLLQMTGLGFASLYKNKYKITSKGRFIHQAGAIILKIWNQKRI